MVFPLTPWIGTPLKASSDPDFLIIVTAMGRSRFNVRLDDEDLGTTDEPLYSTARILMSRGHDPELVLAMRHAGSDTIAMRGRIGRLAGWTVRDGTAHGPRLERYRAHPGTSVFD